MTSRLHATSDDGCFLHLKSASLESNIYKGQSPEVRILEFYLLFVMLMAYRRAHRRRLLLECKEHMIATITFISIISR